LVTGKGHENIQDYGNKIISFSDKKIIKKIIYKKNIITKKNNYQNNLIKKVFKNQNINNLNYNGISINSKTLKKNNLFFAIKGKKVDGHNFVKEAILKGAAKAIVSNKIKKIPKSKIIKVKNTLSSLNNFAREARDRTSAEIIGITGSVGKTTLKNLVSFALQNYGSVCSSPHSYNNKFGVPFSVSNLKENTRYGVFEVGMDRKGEINNLSKIIKPEVGIITNISPAHLKNFNSLRDIAKAKSEIIENIFNDGVIILNKDDKFFNFLSNIAKRRGIQIISFSLKKKSRYFFIRN
jgi:murE/murF fusion protein